MKDNSSTLITLSKQKANESNFDREKEFENNFSLSFQKLNNIHHISRSSFLKGPSIAERFKKTVRNLIKKPVLEKGVASWIN